jgi:hypothetical protein
MKEYIKEAKKRYGDSIYDIEQVDAFIEGVKWQAERMYSEQELRNAMDWMLTQYFEFHEWPAMGRVNHYIQTIKQQEK